MHAQYGAWAVVCLTHHSVLKGYGLLFSSDLHMHSLEVRFRFYAQPTLCAHPLTLPSLHHLTNTFQLSAASLPGPGHRVRTSASWLHHALAVTTSSSVPKHQEDGKGKKQWGVSKCSWLRDSAPPTREKSPKSSLRVTGAWWTAFHLHAAAVSSTAWPNGCTLRWGRKTKSGVSSHTVWYSDVPFPTSQSRRWQLLLEFLLFVISVHLQSWTPFALKPGDTRRKKKINSLAVW